MSRIKTSLDFMHAFGVDTPEYGIRGQGLQPGEGDDPLQSSRGIMHHPTLDPVHVVSPSVAHELSHTPTAHTPVQINRDLVVLRRNTVH